MLALVVAEALETLVSKRMANKITVTFRFAYEPNAEWTALCEYMDDNFRPREFDLIFNMAHLKEPWELFHTACHEVVHIKQYAKGELYQYSRKWRTLRWKDKIVPMHKKLTPLEESKLPWEKEAYKLEDKLFLDIIKKMDQQVRLNNS